MATGGKEDPRPVVSPDEEKILEALHLLGITPRLEDPEGVINLLKAFTKVKEDPSKVTAEPTKKSYQYPRFSTFFGDDGKNDVSWASFKYEVESQLVENNFSEEQILQGIRRSLKGSAYDKLRILGIGAKVADVLEKLESDYGTVESKQSVMRKFYECKQRQDESIETFAARLEDLFDRAVKLRAVSRADTEVLKEGLHAGLKTELRHLTIYQKENYRSYDDFKRELRKIEADTKAEESTEPKKPCKAAVQPEREKSDLSEVKQLLQQLNERIDTLEKEKEKQQPQPNYYPRGQGFRGMYRGRGTGRVVSPHSQHTLRERVVRVDMFGPTDRMGGVVIPIAEMTHRACIGRLVQEVLSQAKLEVKDLDAVAVSVEPGLVPCLNVGLDQAKQLVKEHRVPLVPIHHMEAHALTARMIHDIDFPFLVFLLSGGHCLLAVAKDVDDFLLLGSSLDIAPGDCYDKLARNLKLKTLPQCAGLSGGASVELMAREGDPDVIPVVDVMMASRSCNFSLNGLLEHYKRWIRKQELAEAIQGSAVVSGAHDVCASFQQSVLRHLVKPLQRAFMYTDVQQLLPEHKTLVLSGGVASNQYLRAGIQKLCDRHSCRLVCPPPHLCTDNGIMVAWNGVEKLRLGRGISADPESLTVRGKSPLGRDVSEEVTVLGIKVPQKDLLKDFG